MDALAKRLAQRAGIASFTGKLKSGETQFRVLPVDPDAAKKPRTATGPGRYTLGKNIRLVVSRRGDGDRIVNEASIQFFSPDAAKPAPGKPHKIKLPDGYDTWAAAWARGGTVLWVAAKGTCRSIDFGNPVIVKDQPVEIDKAPPKIRKALQAAVNVGAAAAPATSRTDAVD
jgi:hypothetical protein